MAEGAAIRVVFFGTPDIAVPTLIALAESPNFSVRAAVTQPDKPAGRSRELRASPVKAEAARRGIPVLQPARLRKTEEAFLAEAAVQGPFDVGVVIAFGQILPRGVLTLPVAGCINLHASLLPRWRGAAPIQRALMSGDRETGVCLMRMDEGLDTGPVYSSVRLDISRDDDFGTMHDRIARAAAELTVRDLPRVLRGELAAAAQSADGVTLAAKIENAEAQLRWSEGATSIENSVRALAPIPGAFTTLGGKRLKIFKARALPEFSAGVPGTILAAGPDGVVAACGGSSAVKLLDLQLEGRKRLPVSEFLKGCPVTPGTVLGV